MKFCSRIHPVIGILICLTPGCAEKTKSTSSSSTSPSYQTLTVEWDDSVDKDEFLAWANFEKVRSGVVLEQAPRGQGDLFLGRPWNLVEEVRKGQLAPVAEELIQSRGALRFDDFLPWIRQRILVWDRQAYALPLYGDGWVCLYRKDWLNEAAKKKGLSSAPAMNYWEEFIAAAQLLADAGVTGSPGKSVASLGKSALEWEEQFLWIHAGFSSRAIGSEEKKELFGDNELFGYLYDLKTGDFQPGRVATAEAVKIWVELAKLRVDPKSAANSIDEFLAGQSAIGIFPLPAVARLRASGLIDQVGIAPVPGTKRYANAKGALELANRPNRRPLLGGRLVLGMVRKSSTQQDLAWGLLARAAAPLGERWALGTATAGVTRTDQVLRMRWDRFDLDIANTSTFRDILRDDALHPKIQNPAMYPRRFDAPLRAEKLQVLLAALKPGDPPERLAEDWKKAVDGSVSLPEPERKRVARLCAGLIP